MVRFPFLFVYIYLLGRLCSFERLILLYSELLQVAGSVSSSVWVQITVVP